MLSNYSYFLLLFCCLPIVGRVDSINISRRGGAINVNWASQEMLTQRLSLFICLCMVCTLPRPGRILLNAVFFSYSIFFRPIIIWIVMCCIGIRSMHSFILFHCAYSDIQLSRAIAPQPIWIENMFSNRFCNSIYVYINKNELHWRQKFTRHNLCMVHVCICRYGTLFMWHSVAAAAAPSPSPPAVAAAAAAATATKKMPFVALKPHSIPNAAIFDFDRIADGYKFGCSAIGSILLTTALYARTLHKFIDYNIRNIDATISRQSLKSTLPLRFCAHSLASPTSNAMLTKRLNTQCRA